MKILSLSNTINYVNDKFYVTYVIEKDNKEIATCVKSCETSQEADQIHADLSEILQAQNPSNAIIVDKDSIYTLS